MTGREDNIRRVLQTYEDPALHNCSEGLREVLCEQNFPTCVINSDESHEVKLPSKDMCEEKVLNSCPFNVRALNLCSLYKDTSSNYTVGDCMYVNRTYNHCTINWYLPEWIQQYVQNIDRYLETKLSNVQLKVPRCRNK